MEESDKAIIYKSMSYNEFFIFKKNKNPSKMEGFFKMEGLSFRIISLFCFTDGIEWGGHLSKVGGLEILRMS